MDLFNKFISNSNKFLNINEIEDLFEVSKDGYVLPRLQISDSIIEKYSENGPILMSESSERPTYTYLDILHENIIPRVHKMQALDKAITGWKKCYLVHIKAQMNQDRCIKLSPAEEFSLNSKDPYERIFTNIKLKFHIEAFRFLERVKKINKILLQDIFSVAAGKYAEKEFLRTSVETKFTNDIIVIIRTSAVPITMCINICSETIDQDKDSILLKYSYCLTVLSIGKALSVDAITACYEEGIASRTIVDIQGDGIARLFTI